jgi:hypothetical protein
MLMADELEDPRDKAAWAEQRRRWARAKFIDPHILTVGRGGHASSSCLSREQLTSGAIPSFCDSRH